MLENTIERVLTLYPADGMHGRRKIFTDAREITAENVVKVVQDAYGIHQSNAAEITYLYDYYKGKQDIRAKEKYARPEINNKVMSNRANEIVTFKTAYLLSEPIQYVSAGESEEVSRSVLTLNEYMRAEDKESADKELFDWIHICGVGVRACLADPAGEEDGSPASIYVIDPRDAFVVYSSGLGAKPMCGVILQNDERGERYFAVYAPGMYYKILGGEIVNYDKFGDGVKGQRTTYSRVPIVEYENNHARMGAFEPVISLLNAINTLESNRVDSVQDYVNSYDVFQNCEISSDSYSELAQGGKRIEVKSAAGCEAKVYRIYSEISQTGVQTAVDDLYDSVLTICGMPNRNGGSSTSDTGQATIFRDGWQSAESRAKDTEKSFMRSEREFLRVFISICHDVSGLDLRMSDIKIEFTRKNLVALQSKVQMLTEMLNNDRIHPKLAFQYSGVFADSEDAYRMSEAFYDEEQRKLNEQISDEVEDA